MTFPVFAPGNVLNASDMNAVGLWKIKQQTIGSAVSSVTVSDVFSADYDNYFITVSGGAASTGLNLLMTLGATATGYYWSHNGYTFAGASSTGNGANTTSWLVGRGETAGLSAQVCLYNPNKADETWFTGAFVALQTSGYRNEPGGYLANTTAYTAFTLTTSTGTLTGGDITVYGMRL